jgi:dolichyl-phosphate beta-glucosyltransferase
MVVGARVKLLGREIERRAARHYSGRVFATVASLLLNLPIYDTQCGAKLFRASSELKGILAESFQSRWIFDVEIIARLIRSRRITGGDPVEHSIYEVPLRQWMDVRGSKVRLSDFFTAGWDLLRIHWQHLR